jgi:uncharacterized NAD-dependent epimerase/dehydratase family protein
VLTTSELMRRPAHFASFPLSSARLIRAYYVACGVARALCVADTQSKPRMLAIAKPYLTFLGDGTSLAQCKTAFGLRDWCRDDVVAQCGLAGCSVDLGVPWMSPRDAAAHGARSLVIGVAPIGGAIPQTWWPVFSAALEAGLDIVSGMHTRLTTIPGLADAASARARTLHDVRHPQRSFAVATGRKRAGRRLLTVGTDCAIGKKYAALAITKALSSRGVAAEFRATGQTGILIAGSGVAIDAVVADFVAGAAEWLSPANDVDHWDVVEGQGALCHPAYAGVTMGLVHGTQPDALVLCHDPARMHLEGYPEYPIPDLKLVMDQYLAAAHLTNPRARFVGIGLNTSTLDDDARKRLFLDLTVRFGLPLFDPIRDGGGVIAQRLLDEFSTRAAS